MRGMRIGVVVVALIALVAWLAIGVGRRSGDRVSLMVTGGTVVTMDAGGRVIEDAAVAIQGDTIVAVGPRLDIEGRYHAASTIDARGQIILPGLINAHTHVPMVL